MLIKGYIDKKIFDSGNGFKIYSFCPNDKYISQVQLTKYGNISIKGDLPTLVNGKEYELDVEYEKKGQYESYVVKQMLSNPMDMNDLESYNFLSELVGEKTTKSILDVYPNFIKLIISGKESQIDLSKIKGVGDFRFNQIRNKIKENIMYYNIISEYKDYELTMSQVKKIHETYKSFEKLKEKMDENPYRCLCSIAGISFSTADSKILNKNRALASSLFRMAECILFMLNKNETEGNTWIKSNVLYSDCSKVTPECINEFKNALEDKQIYYDKESKKVAKKSTYNCELEISNILKEFLNEERILNIDYNKYNCVDGVALTEKQTLSTKYACNHNFYILSGFGGSGKTFSTKALINMLDDNNLSYILLAPTGKASKNLTLNTNRHSSTIHRGLCYNPAEGFLFNKDNKLKVDFVIVDEATMIDIFLMRSLLQAIDTKKTKLVFICDTAQISSVGCGNCLQDIVNSKLFPVIFLDKVFRYEEGGLAKVATDTRNGERFIFEDGIQKFGNDFVFLPVNKDNIVSKILQAYKKMEEKGGGVDDIVILSAYNKGELGTYKLNSLIQEYVNPLNDREEISYMRDKVEIKFREKDRVMQIVNNYKTPMCDIDGNILEETCCVFNGDDGMVVKIGKTNKNEKYMIVNFGGKLTYYKGEDIRSLLLGYSISGHKCLVEDTYLYTSEGILKLKDFNNNAKEGEFKNIDNEIKVYNGQFMEKPKAFLNAGKSLCNKIVTKRGYEIICTNEHGLDVLNEQGKVERKNGKDLKVGDYVLISKNANIFGNNCDLPKFKPMLDVRAKKYNIPKKLTPELSELLGMIVADGTIFKNGIRFGKNQKETVERFKHLSELIFGYEGKEIKHLNGEMGGMYFYEIFSSLIKDFLWSFEGLRPNNKFIPSVIMKTNKENQCAFLKGLFEDGTVNCKKGKFDHIELSLKEKEICIQVRILLLNLGIISTLKHRKNRKYDIWSIYIYKNDAKLYYKYINFISLKKRERLKTCLSKSTQCNYTIPNIYKIILDIEVRNNLNLKDCERELYYFRFRKRNNFSNDLLTKFIDYYEEELKDDLDFKYLKYINKNCFIDCIESINKEYHNTYCLEMPITHKFVQNGFIGWNCQGSGYPFVIAVTPPTHKFFLNRNLLYVMYTRAKKFVYNIGTIDTIESALKKSDNQSRQTFLEELLIS